MRRLFLAFLRSETGATAIEYGLIAALIAVGALAGISTAGNSIQGVFTYAANKAGNVWDSVP